MLVVAAVVAVDGIIKQGIGIFEEHYLELKIVDERCSVVVVVVPIDVASAAGQGSVTAHSPRQQVDASLEWSQALATLQLVASLVRS